jgi:hypothetical protein
MYCVVNKSEKLGYEAAYGSIPELPVLLLLGEDGAVLHIGAVPGSNFSIKNKYLISNAELLKRECVVVLINLYRIELEGERIQIVHICYFRLMHRKKYFHIHT